MEFAVPWSSLLGGILLGASALLLLLFNGKVAGISGIIGGLISPEKQDFLWRLLFLLGMMGGGWLAIQFLGITFPSDFSASPMVIIIAGLFVGLGSGLGNGCTSGHGICGIGRLSVRSIAATCTFMAVAAVTVFIRLHVM
ncbi:YeeE/YedE thiosulfate transporter family protein [uncultured Endozoicomonas sp.]|uniref:YeeE/YedE family protein n=1 Tax=uncultured Endozoicomonas sp. TaxID=432652 RepID=UPI00260E7F70|nr:YeeE/YedE thiosulfate transporter family protein [uncultured Endozoicomonas sp.]